MCEGVKLSEVEPHLSGAVAPEKERKKRTANPGVRIQGGRIYDSENGTTCHQCRQKTVEVKAKCGKCTLYWCPRCLLNRYGEAVEAVVQLQAWPCPRCRGDCNCSNCRKKRGLEATGILAGMSKAAGFTSVSQLLVTNPNAKRPASANAKRPADAPADAPAAKAQKVVNKAEVKPKAEPAPKAPQRMDDAELPPRAPLAGEALRVHRSNALGRRARGPAWPLEVGDDELLPAGCDAGKVLEVLEFLEVFGIELGLSLPNPALLAAELLQPPNTRARSVFTSSLASPVVQLHARLADTVQAGCAGGALGALSWQGLVQQYLGDEADAAGAAALAAPALDYWALPPDARLHALHRLCHAALDTPRLRACIEGKMEEADARERARRAALLAARKESREALAQQRNEQAAALLAGNPEALLTIDEQRAIMDRSRALAQAAASGGAAGAGPAPRPPPEARALPLGRDRHGTAVWRLSAAPVLTGRADGLLLALGSSDGQAWQALGDPAAAVAALDPAGCCEAALRAALAAEAGLPPDGAAAGGKVAKRAAAHKQLKRCTSAESESTTEHVAKAGGASMPAQPGAPHSRKARASQLGGAGS